MKCKCCRWMLCAIFCLTGMASVALAEENPVKNSSFFSGTLYWQNAQASDEGHGDTGALLQQILREGSQDSYQEINGLEAGEYTLTAYIKNNGGQHRAYLYGKSGEESFASTALPASGAWEKVCVRGIKVMDGTLRVGIFAQAQGNSKILMDDVVVEKEENVRPFLLGGDITELTYVEDCGGTFYDREGQEKDALQIMAENGMNLARIRVYHQTGKGTGKDGYYLPAYYQTQQDALNLARRAKSKGMAIELTFHYSDYWTNGGTQMIPSQWRAQLEGLSDAEAKQKLEQLVYDDTYQMLEKMKAQGTAPEYISLGNEMQAGILYPYGRNSDWDALSRFLNAGAKACRQVCPEAKIILHLDEGGNTQRYIGFFDRCEKYNVDYDVIGPSYYPFWTGRTVSELVDFCNEISAKYDKDIMIMETGYNFYPTKPDGWPGQLSDNGPYEKIYGATQRGHRDFMAELVNGLKTVEGGRCIGDIYWDPVMIACEGVGWAYQESTDQADTNVVSNTALFDFDGKAIQSMEVYQDNRIANKECILTGTIKDMAGAAVPKAEMLLNVGEKQVAVQADRYGMFFARVPSGGEVTITAQGMQGAYVKTLTNAQQITTLDFVTETPGRLVGDNFRTEETPEGQIIRNLTEQDQELELVLVFYDENEILNGMRWEKHTVGAGQSVKIEDSAANVQSWTQTRVYIKQEGKLVLFVGDD